MTRVEALTPDPFTVLGWVVDDIAAAMSPSCVRAESSSRSMTVSSRIRPRVWTAPGGARIAWFRDPDGNTLSLTEF